jgi:hypothetical protein
LASAILMGPAGPRSDIRRVNNMWRAVFLALGITLCILGGECLVVEKAVLAQSDTSPPPQSSFLAPTTQDAREIKPPEWAPWSLLSGGAVILLYSYTVPKRVAT